jgi:endonuclease/exonuclease/phosphatase family metal-dependent hydrolase
VNHAKELAMLTAIRWVCVLGAMAVLFGPLGASAAEDDEAPPVQSPAKSFSVATFNICWGNMDLPKTAAVIRKARADVVCLQETNAASEAFLRQQLRGDYRYITFRGDRGRWDAERLGFLSKRPLHDLRFLPARHGLFGTWIARTELGGRSVQLVNVHLQPIILSQQAGLSGALAAFSAMEKVHGDEIRAIVENLKEEVPTVLAGDLNSISSFDAPQFLAKQGFVDSFASVTERPDDHRSWHWPIGQAEFSARIDYLFHTADFRTRESRILDGESSDHLLVVSRLEWNDEKPKPPAEKAKPAAERTKPAAKKPATASQLVGAWKLVSIDERRADGQRVTPADYGPEPIGLLIYDASGYMSAQAMRRGRGKLPSDDVHLAPPQQTKEAFVGYNAYFGKYEVREAEGIVIHHVEGSMIPNWEGGAQRRRFTLEGDKLILEPPPFDAAGEKRTRRLTWQRLPRAVDAAEKPAE